MSACEVCRVRLLKTREPKATACHVCRKPLCPAHAHYYVDESNIAITMSARPSCATCAGMVTVHCFFGPCSQIVEHRDPEQASQVMEVHYDEVHADDLAALGYPVGGVV